MMKLPEKFTAVDPVSGEEMHLESKMKHLMVVDQGLLRKTVNKPLIRALIEYGRQMERDAIAEEDDASWVYFNEQKRMSALIERED